MKIIVIGGGAVGLFTAINIAKKHTSYKVVILEKTSKLLQKVKVSGGGRCNVTNARSKPSELVSFYPRGYKKLYSVFKKFTSSDMIAWLAERGVATKTEDDLRMFPLSDSSQTIINCFLEQAKKYKVEILTNNSLTKIHNSGNQWVLQTNKGLLEAQKVVIATGSAPASRLLLRELGLSITKTVPSLFTFNITDERIKNLQGISFKEASIKIAGSRLTESGPLLITHHGLSGPAILKLSSWGAYELSEKNYQFEILLNFINTSSEEAQSSIKKYKEANPNRKVINYPLFDLPKRFWGQLIEIIGIDHDTTFNKLSKKHVNKLVEELSQGRYRVKGKNTFKEEFVTAGGISLSEVDLNTFQCKRFPGLYMAGEILDIDALTGGFNFQACWSAGWLVSENI